MRITDIEIFPLTIPMKQRMEISGGVIGDVHEGAPHVYVKITTDHGVSGWGEARPSPRWSYETPETVTSTIKNYFIPVLIGEDVNDLHAIHQKMDQQIASGVNTGQPIAKAAIDMAVHDCIAKAQGKNIVQLWHKNPIPTIKLSYLISPKSPEEAEQKVEEAIAGGFEGIDLKVGINKGKDKEILKVVSEKAKHMFIRVDANQAYTFTEALQLSKYMENLSVDVFEQPLPANDLVGHAALRKKTDVPIALDESIWAPLDLMQAIKLEALDMAVIKVTKMGGLKGARLCGEIADAANLNLLGGGLSESNLAFTASAHLFNYLSITTPVDLNGPFLLADDPVENDIPLHQGKAKLPTGAGIGCTISEQKLNQFL